MIHLFKITLKTALLAFILYGCESNQLVAPIDCDLEGPSLMLVDKSNANCGESDGTVELSATGGQGNLVFSSDDLPEQNDGAFTGLPAGAHSFFVTDENLCRSELIVTIGNEDGVSISTVDLIDAGCGVNTGELKISATGGVRPYSYKVDDSSFQSDSIFTSLSEGSHTVQVKDDSGCEFSQEVEVMSGISLSSHISPIISNNCAVSGCHNGSQFPDLRQPSSIIANANRIKVRTGNRSMPQGGTLTQLQIDQISCWVGDGALDN
ncbi:MAG: SprB repeat-containing protein [Cyclobacteriaceae bacterium]